MKGSSRVLVDVARSDGRVSLRRRRFARYLGSPVIRDLCASRQILYLILAFMGRIWRSMQIGVIRS